MKKRLRRDRDDRTADLLTPEGWGHARVADIFDSWGGMTPSKSDPSYWGGNVAWVSSKDIKKARIAAGSEFITPKALRETRLRLCQPGSVLVVVRSGILASTLPISVVESPLSINQDLKAFYCSEPILNEWLSLSLRALERQILAENRKDGTTVQSIRFDELKNISLPIPPLGEQRRIIRAAEELISTFSPIKGRLSSAARMVKRLRQVVLEQACSGKLTEDWRNANLDVGRSQSSRDEVEAWAGQDLPNGWKWTDAGSLYVDARYGTSVKCDKSFPSGVPVLRVPNISRGELALENLKYAQFSARELRSLTVEPGDILVCRTNGSLDLIGKAAVIPVLDRAYTFASYLIRLRLQANALLPRYFHIVLSSRIGRNQIEERARTSAGQFNLNLEILRGLVVPLPSVEEQREIIRRVEGLFQLADAIEKRVEAAAARAEKLTHAVLSKAFKGELVPTEAELARAENRGYEPASVLLERIGANNAGVCGRR